MMMLRAWREGRVPRRADQTSRDALLRIGEQRRQFREELAEVLSWEVGEDAARALREVSEVGQ